MNNLISSSQFSVQKRRPLRKSSIWSARSRSSLLVPLVIVGVVLFSIMVSLVIMGFPNDIRNKATEDTTTVTLTAVDLCTPWIQQTAYPYFSQSFPGSMIRSLAEFTLEDGTATQVVWLQDAAGAQTSYVRTASSSAGFRPDWAISDAQSNQGFTAAYNLANLISMINSGLSDNQKLSTNAQLIDQSVVTLPTSALIERLWMKDNGTVTSFVRMLPRPNMFFLSTAASTWKREELAEVVPSCVGKEVLAAGSALDVESSLKFAQADQPNIAAYTETIYCGGEVYARSVPVSLNGTVDWSVLQSTPDKGWKPQDRRYLPADVAKVMAFREEIYSNPTGNPDNGSLMREIQYESTGGLTKLAIQALPLTIDFGVDAKAGYENCQGIQ